VCRSCTCRFTTRCARRWKKGFSEELKRTVSVVVGFDIGGANGAVSVGGKSRIPLRCGQGGVSTPKDSGEAIEALCALALRLAGKENILSGSASARAGPWTPERAC
jgi:hypothetical protein